MSEDGGFGTYHVVNDKFGTARYDPDVDEPEIHILFNRQEEDQTYEYRPRSVDRDAFMRYSRPRPIQPTNGEFMLTDITSVEEEGLNYIGPVLRLYGVNELGNSAVVEVRDFWPYFYVYGLPSDTRLDVLRNEIERVFRSTWPPRYITNNLKFRICRSVSLEQVRWFMGCRLDNDGMVPMFRVTVALPNYVRHIRMLFEKGQILQQKCETFEAGILYVMRYMADIGLKGCGWFRVDNFKHVNAPGDFARSSFYTDFVLRVEDPLSDIVPLPNKNIIAPFRWLAYDIEACKLDGRGFVSPEEDPVTHIGCRLRAHPNIVLDDVVFCLVPYNQHVNQPDKNRRIEEFEDERDLLMRFCQYMCQADADAFTGWNINGFDWNYLFLRAKRLGLDQWAMFGREVEKRCTIRAATFTSAAYGTREDFATNIEGRFDFDMFKYVLRDMKLRSYSLNAVLTKLFGRQKVDMPYDKIPEYQNGTDEQRGHLAEYCWNDAAETLNIADKRKAVNNSVEQARICGIPMKWLTSKGQQIKTLGKLLPLADGRGFRLPTSTPEQNDDFTQGATVKEPQRGFYKGPVICQDFSSLYPSIIVAYNICYTTKMSIEAAIARGLIPGVDFNVPPIEGCTFCFVKKHIRLGLLPEMCENFMSHRKRAKAEMFAEQDPEQAAILDARQLQLKIICNSVYGFMKANMLCDKDLMSAVTAWGREMLERTTQFVESYYTPQAAARRYTCAQRVIRILLAHESFRDIQHVARTVAFRPLLCSLKHEQNIINVPAKVIYGDSVTKDTPILIRYPDGTINYVCIEDIPRQTEWEHYGDEKEMAQPISGLEIWSDKGFTPIVRVIRHLTRKSIFRVTTLSGTVDVTEDHSLLTPDGKEITPNQVSVGDELMHAALPLNITLPVCENDSAKIMLAKIFLCKQKSGEIKDLKITTLENLGPCNDYVYDLETGNHHFAAGVGQLIVHNTDSVMIYFDEIMPFDNAKHIGRDISYLTEALFLAPNKLVFEKLMQPFLLLMKKRYASVKFEDKALETREGVLDVKGFESKRRDNAKIGSETQEAVLKKLLIDVDVPGAIQLLHDVLRKLLTNQVDMSMLVISKGLSKSFKVYEEKKTKQAHVELAKRIEARASITGEDPYATGDRVKYVMRVPKHKKELACDRAEDPLYVLKNRIPIDVNYYIEKQLAKWVCRILTPVIAKHESTLRRVQNKKGQWVNKDLTMNQYRQLTVYKLIFQGDHMRSIHQTVNITDKAGIGQFLVPKYRCLGCKAAVSSANQPVCKVCEYKRTAVHTRLLEQHVQLTQQHEEAWNRCQVCVGRTECVSVTVNPTVARIPCNNMDCDNFFRRTKLDVDIEDLGPKLKRFNM